MDGSGGNPDNDFFEINESGILHWYFEDGGYDFDYESTNDSNQDNLYEILVNAWDENDDLIHQQNIQITIHDIDDTAAGISITNGNLEEIATDENDYFLRSKSFHKTFPITNHTNGQNDEVSNLYG